MRKIYKVSLTLLSIFAMHSVFAGEAEMSADSKPCGMIAKACMHAGYAKKNEGKGFWTDCMKPVILGQTVKDVKVDAELVKTCRADKIKQLQQDLNDFQNAS
ncbi:MAG TPA: hypothetical protein VLH77_05875 [Gammaproteobacteria bacterium]|nr:hypothetical protein [Gammaproteobacteria bacterium]